MVFAFSPVVIWILLGGVGRDGVGGELAVAEGPCVLQLLRVLAFGVVNGKFDVTNCFGKAIQTDAA